MENVKGAPLEYKRVEPLTFAAASPSAAVQSANLLAAGTPVLLCRQVTTVRPELLFGLRVCELEAVVYRDTGDVAEVGFGSHAELRLAATCSTSEATDAVKQFGIRELRVPIPVSVTTSDQTELALLARHWQPRVHVAFAFAPTRMERQLADLWRSFGGAYALIPKATYVQVRGSSYLCYLLTPPDGVAYANPTLEAVVNDALDRLERSTRMLAEHDTLFPSDSHPDALALPSERAMQEPDLDTSKKAWAKQVDSALVAIGTGVLEKVVPARYSEHRLASDTSHAVTQVSALYALGNTHTDSTKFAFRSPAATFVGATPEHLISKVGSTLTTEALAGTTASSTGSLQSFTPKEYHEHSPVLDAILSSLAPFCSELTHEVTPVPLRLPHILHLRTAISGSLSDPHTHVLDLVRVLHPTPAVAGAPRGPALEWIASHEDFERGWYAGPIGWFDAQGDGEFDVALRCGVLTEERAVLFAGAGIVEGSIPEKEFEETVLKLRAMRTALSAPTPTVHLETSKT